ncbi:methyltransferase domain-containing protein [Microbulbifer hainanensis]|uniref:methyltransferase domain-containing protein n=1 Tax=Microbulbifer hainanensis TaxID=2735675 RepID=UPI0018677A6E|nr:class I SAM-dependent methyltransferase [Microbulbifer hainanensis]
MALVWEKRVGDCHYQVRSHGASVRLFSNGVFHSQWNPRDPLKGSLWELLLLPAFFCPPAQIRSVLLLGVGGGALIRLLQRFVQPQSIVGVDLDPVHLQVARRHFGVREATLVCADARDYVANLVANLRASGKKGSFDLVIDDLFGHVGGEAQRTVTADSDWCRNLLELVADTGVLVANFGGRREFLASGWRAPELRRELKGSWTASLPAYENCIFAASRSALSMGTLHREAPAAINPQNPSGRLQARWQRQR